MEENGVEMSASDAFVFVLLECYFFVTNAYLFLPEKENGEAVMSAMPLHSHFWNALFFGTALTQMVQYSCAFRHTPLISLETSAFCMYSRALSSRFLKASGSI